MIRLNIQGDPTDAIDAELAALAGLRVDLSGAIEPAREAVQEANRRAREAGLDKDGVPLIPVKESTRRRRAAAGGDPAAAPLIPRHAGSRAELGARVSVEPTADNRLDVQIGWPGQFWLSVHALGESPGAPVRDILGMPPGALDAVDEIVANEADRRVLAIFDHA